MVTAQGEDGVLDPQGPVSEAIAGLWWLMLGLSAIVFVAVVVVLAMGLFRRRPAADQETGRERPKQFGRWFVVGGVVAPLLILTIVFGATVRALRLLPTASPEALVIEVVGHQFWWEVRYPDEGITLSNELHLPVGRPVNLRLSSADVIHSFWVPALAGKIDLLPDHPNTLVLEADQPGVHRSRCAEFCGLQHTKMVLTVVAEPEDRFDAWVAERRG
jgi:cytochrome c oxidase subunit II